MRKILLLSCFFSFVPATFACTTFFINKNGQLIFGRNYDWVTGNGMVCTNQRGLSKTSYPFAGEETINWVSLYGSITFNQYGKEFPTGGMNEKGLVVELMWLDGTRYPDTDERPALGVLQWVQYQLDNCSTIQDVIATDKKIRISSKGTSPLHYLIADANGHAASIEFLDGKMVVHKGSDLPFAVLTNSGYAESLRLTGFGSPSLPANFPSFNNNSIERFAKACNRINTFQQKNINTPVVDYAFTILDEVAQMNTKWSIVYDIANKKIWFRTKGYTELKELAFSSINMDCKVTSKTGELNQHIGGNITSRLSDYSDVFNRKIVERSFTESRSEFTVSDETVGRVWRFPGLSLCKN